MSTFCIQGHRGARGLMPENTLPAFHKAIALGVDVLELDVCISKDKKVVVSHEPYFKADFSVKPNGDKITKAEEKKYNLFEMNYDEIQLFDVGINGNKHFPEQQKIAAYKPLLSEVFQIIQSMGFDIKYNIEIKSNKKDDGIWQPSSVKEFCELVYQQVKHLPPDKLTIQSFDFRVLRHWNQQITNDSYKKCKLSVLVERKSIKNTLKDLGFIPSVFSPNFKHLQEATIVECQHRQLQIIPWTVNNVEDMQRLIKWGVDGFITDYPNRARGLY